MQQSSLFQPDFPAELQVVRNHPDAILPTYGTDGAAAFDLYSVEDGLVKFETPRVFNTGLIFLIPRGFALLVFSRSGMGFSQNLSLANSVGVIDSDYRGEVKVKLTQSYDITQGFFTGPTSPHPGSPIFHSGPGVQINKGDRIAQAMLVPAPQVRLKEAPISALTSTIRGAGGFGSTGA